MWKTFEYLSLNKQIYKFDKITQTFYNYYSVEKQIYIKFLNKLKKLLGAVLKIDVQNVTHKTWTTYIFNL